MLASIARAFATIPHPIHLALPAALLLSAPAHATPPCAPLASTTLSALSITPTDDATGHLDDDVLTLCTGSLLLGDVQLSAENVRVSPATADSHDGFLVHAGPLTVHVDHTGPTHLSGALTGVSPLWISGPHRLLDLSATRLTVHEDGRVLLDIPRDHRFFQAILPRLDVPIDTTGLALLRAYGALYLSTGTIPPVVRFHDEAAVTAFQRTLDTTTVSHNGQDLVLQTPAATALRLALDAAATAGHTLVPHAEGASIRSYATTTRYWRPRVEAGLAHWVTQGRLDADEAARIRTLDDAPQVDAVLSLEARGLYFHEKHTRSILYTVAAPGSSQHIALLAVDFIHPSDAVVALLAEHGWFRTVLGDRDHFTWLGKKPASLPESGLIWPTGWRQYWAPDL